MSAIIEFFENRSDLQVTDLKLALFLESYKVNSFKEYHTILTNMKKGQQVLFMGDYDELVGQTRTVGACAIPKSIGGISTSKKTWNPTAWGEQFEFCSDDWQPYISQFALAMGINQFDMANTDIMDMVVDRIAKRIQQAHWIKAWFGDTASAAFDASPDGVLIEAKYVPFFSTFDGYFKQMVDYTATDDTAEKQLVAIAGNNKVTYDTYAKQLAWATTASETHTGYNKAYDVAHGIAFSTPAFIRKNSGKTALCTRMYYDALMQNFIGKGLESMYVNLTEGVEGLKVLGITYIPIDDWDTVIENYEHDGTKYNNPFRVVVTPKENLQYATTGSGEIGIKDASTFYVQKDHKTYLEFLDETDAKVVMNNQFIIAI